MSTGKRLRFEILKRDGFRCRYCGATAVSALLHVDHVVPVVEGGLDDPANLVTACADCNLGKSDVQLTESQLEPSLTATAMAERAEQVQAYIETLKAFEAAREALRDHYSDIWRARVGNDPPMALHRRWDTLDAEHGEGLLLYAMDAVAQHPSLRTALNEVKYFHGVLRNRRAQR